MSAHHTLTINIDQAIWACLQELAKERRSTERTLIHYAIEEYLARQTPSLSSPMAAGGESASARRLAE